jgi:protein SCO1/2
LIDQTGSPVGTDDLKGHVWIASFIYTTCPGPCPRVVQGVAAVQRRIGDEPGLRIVSISVDPAADTPVALGVYGSARGIDPNRWKLLTGTVEDVIDLVRHGFLLVVASADEVASDARKSEGPVVHSVHLVLVDGAMRIRGYYDSTDPEALDRLVEDTRRLLRDAAS